MAPALPAFLAAEKPNRVFINQGGLFYAAPQALSVNDAESTFPTPDMIEVLSKQEQPISREVMIDKILKLGASRMNAVLAPATPTEEKNA